MKAAPESAVRYVATELGPNAIRVHAVSPGPLASRAASGIKDFDNLMERVPSRAPARRLVTTQLGFHLKAEAIDWPNGMPGDVGFILTWKRPEEE